jgi:hypothetical protein
MIPYEDITVGDAQLYWNGCTCFVHNSETGIVSPYRLVIEVETEYDEDDEPREDSRGDMFDEYSAYLAPSCAYGTGRWVSGRRLFKGPEYIMHRFAVEYVPIFDEEGKATRVVRVCVEPLGRMAFKGLNTREVTYLPLIEVANARAIAARYGTVGIEPILLAYAAPAFEDGDELQRGIAAVLSVGTPPSMRRLITEEEASRNARALVRDLFTGDSTVAVPDYSLCVVKHRSHNDMGYVLYRGNVLGTVRYADGEVHFVGTLGSSANAVVRDAVRKGKQSLVNRLITNNITWEV